MYYVYVLIHSESGDTYVGYSDDLKRRLDEHNKKHAGYTHRLRGVWELVYYEAFREKELAQAREQRLKSHGRVKQELFKRIGIS